MTRHEMFVQLVQTGALTETILHQYSTGQALQIVDLAQRVPESALPDGLYLAAVDLIA